MPNISNPQAVLFANENARVIADMIESLDRTMSQFMLNVVRDYEPNTGANLPTDYILDGSVADGRARVTHYDVGALKYVVEQLLACLAQADRRAIVHRWAVNGRPKY